MMRARERSERILDEGAVAAAVERMADAVYEGCADPSALVLVGIRTGGVPLAERLARRLQSKVGHTIPIGTLDITLYRDDLLRSLDQPEVGPTQIPVGLKDRWVVLVDDVVFTGRTVRAAIDALMDFGRPRRIVLAVLVDRGGREVPIAPDVVGRVVKAPLEARIEVDLKEVQGRDEVRILFG